MIDRLNPQIEPKEEPTNKLKFDAAMNCLSTSSKVSLLGLGFTGSSPLAAIPR
jgi:hypothetical protein